MRDPERVQDRPHRASHRLLRRVPLTVPAAHRDQHQDRNLEGDIERRERVDRVAQAARLQHDGRPDPAQVQARGDAERLLFTRRQRRTDVRMIVRERAQDMREWIVRHVDDLAALERG